MFTITETDESRFDVRWNDEVVGTFSSHDLAEAAVVLFKQEGGAR